MEKRRSWLSRGVTGAILNAAGIVIGGLIGLAWRTPLAPQTQAFFKLAIGLLTMFFGLRLAWSGLSGDVLHVFKQIGIALLAIVVGNLLGQLLGFQRTSNRLGQYARQLMESARPGEPQRFHYGLTACSILFCAAPLGWIGAVTDGLVDDYHPLAVKALMDGLAMMGFVTMFGWGATLAALPVFLLQGTITLACDVWAGPWLRELGLVQSVSLVAGLIICAVGLVIFEIRRVELADFLPALAVAPLLTWWWR
ncbi:MAG: DUF554 domain-containing protein [Verrucomicrobiae bacterium]|nr:DUF554 domain-containing protein [Verrucomicrobiae bacterium]